MDLFVLWCSQNHGKGMKIERNEAFWTIVKKATFLYALLIQIIRTKILQ